VQNNRFEVLVEKELESYKEHDTVIEDEINVDIQDKGVLVEIEATSSQDDDFVDNTQHFPILERILPAISLVPSLNVEHLEKERLLEIEKKNKEFLDHSWANIIEYDEAGQRLLKHLEEDHRDDFQVVCRSKGKTTKKIILVKSTYQTRNEDGSPKPFR